MKTQVSALISVLSFCLAACSSVPAGGAKPGAASPPAEMTTRARVQLVVQLLDQGQEERALSEIETVLAVSPGNAATIHLRNQVQSDPQKMLGASYRAYTALPGDTLSSLARTHLGDAMLFYALSQYNDLPAPNRLMVGQSLKIPDKYPGAPKSAFGTPGVSKPIEGARKVSSNDVGAARSLRLQALEHLNKGNADQAVVLLEQAARLDSSNKSISTDLARAQRIRQTLQKPD